MARRFEGSEFTGTPTDEQLVHIDEVFMASRIALLVNKRDHLLEELDNNEILEARRVGIHHEIARTQDEITRATEHIAKMKSASRERQSSDFSTFNFSLAGDHAQLKSEGFEGLATPVSLIIPLSGLEPELRATIEELARDGQEHDTEQSQD